MTDTFAAPNPISASGPPVHGAHDLDRFVEAQSPVIATALAELAAGRKRGHWMWFVFPQLRGLGRSETARHFGLRSLDEARAYLHHPALGPRLRDASTTLLTLHDGQSVRDIFGSPDDLKLRSCMTLFELADEDSPAPSVFAEVLRRYFSDVRDELTLDLLKQGAPDA